MNNQPQKVKKNGKQKPNNSNAHINLTKIVLDKNEYNQNIGHNIKEMMLMKHDQHFSHQQYNRNLVLDHVPNGAPATDFYMVSLDWAMVWVYGMGACLNGLVRMLWSFT